MDLLLLTAEPHPDVVLPSLSLLAHTVRTAPPDVSSLLEAGSADVLIIDARVDLPAARGLSRLLGSTGRSTPVVVVVNEGGLVAVNADWGLDEILLPGTGPAEIDARLRLLIGRRGSLQDQESLGKITLGELVIDESTYTFTFHVEGALVRTLIGKDLPRAFELSGKQLIVKSTHPEEHWRVAWEHY